MVLAYFLILFLLLPSTLQSLLYKYTYLESLDVISNLIIAITNDTINIKASKSIKAVDITTKETLLLSTMRLKD